MFSTHRYSSFFLFCLCVVATIAQASELSGAFAQAQYTFDRDSAEVLLPQFREAAEANGNEAAWLDYAHAALLVAELRRGDYEHATLEKKAKRALGKAIDQVAEAGLGSLQPLPESSERYRLEADLLGTMIRSKFKGMKYQPRLEKAIARALELDDGNANAWVSQARRPLFASPEHGGDPALALLYLNRALDIDADHVQALLFRGAAHAKLGNSTLAENDWARATALNPNTAEARDRLLNIEMPFE